MNEMKGSDGIASLALPESLFRGLCRVNQNPRSCAVCMKTSPGARVAVGAMRSSVAPDAAAIPSPKTAERREGAT